MKLLIAGSSGIDHLGRAVQGDKSNRTIRKKNEQAGYYGCVGVIGIVFASRYLVPYGLDSTIICAVFSLNLLTKTCNNAIIHLLNLFL